ncbi:hypothetical protein [Sphingobacterium multivorum]|uniref:hypothetical protein n=1 Tax=Sphingobacterium multivorum TaxID=28454 RepID=UPI003DA39680
MGNLEILEFTKRKKEAIIRSYGEYWDSLSEPAKECALNNNGKISHIISGCGKIPHSLITYYNEGFRPRSLRGIESNNGWNLSIYHPNGENTLIENPFIEGEWYELGFMEERSGKFLNLGIHMYESGFFYGGYQMKPFPTHFKLVEESRDPIY